MNEKKIASNRPMTEFERGQWDMFELITSTYYGKQYFFLEENGTVYSRGRGKYITFADAVNDFIDSLDREAYL